MDERTDLREAAAHHAAGRYDDAEAACRRVLGRRPESAGAHHLLGLIAHDCRRPDDALAHLRRSVELAPGVPDFHSNFGCVLDQLGHRTEAVAAFNRSLALRPDYAVAHSNLGVALEGLDRLDEAVAAYREAVRLDPAYAEAHNNLGNALRKAGRLDDAIAAYRAATTAKPAFVPPHQGLGSALAELGDLAGAIAALRQVVRLSPESAAAHSDLIHTLHYDPACEPKELFDEAVAWGRRHAPPERWAGRRHDNDPDPDRRLRVGYVSADFRDHPVGRLVLPVLAARDRERIEVYCYSDVRRADTLTGRLRDLADGWRDTAGVPDAALDDLVRSDRVDVLVDLSGHFGDNRMTLFGRKPAPVQVTQFGYCDTTGVRAVDYRVTDALSDPAGVTDPYHVERLVRLPDCCWCYVPCEPTPDVGPLPAAGAGGGGVTFACLNKFVKVGDPAAAAWARILGRVPGSRLLLLADAGPAADYARDRLGRFGVPADRVEFAGRCPRAEYLALHNRIDVALDPFPFNGDNTTCDALWMGVPVVALAGGAFVSRRGMSHLTNVGLPDLVGVTVDDYVDAAVDLAGDLDRLAALRAGLRDRLRGSPLGDAAAFTRRLEAAYRDMWRRWARGRGGG